MSRFLPWFVLLGVSAIWGGSFAAIRYLVQWVSPTDLLVLRFVPTALMVVPLILIWHRRDFGAALPRLWWLFIGLGALWLYGYHYLLNLGETVLPAAPAGLIIATYPIFTVFLASVFLGEKLTGARVVGGLIGFAGTALLTIAGASQEAAQLDIITAMWVKFSLITLIAPVTVAIHTIVIKPYLTGSSSGRPVSSFVMNYGYMAPTGLLVLTMWKGDLVTRSLELPVMFWLVLGFLVVFCTILANIGYFWALQRIETGPVAISTYLIPLFSLGYARIFLRESIGLVTIVAAGCIVAGVIVASAGDRLGRSRLLTSRGG